MAIKNNLIENNLAMSLLQESLETKKNTTFGHQKLMSLFETHLSLCDNH